MSTTNPVQLQESSPAKACSDLPEGWALPRIGEVLEVKYGKGLKKNNRISGPVPVYGSNGIVGEHNTSLTEGPAIILGRKGTVGAVHFSNTPCWAIDTTYYIDDFNGLVPEYLLCALKILNLAGLDTSTAIPGLNRNDLYNRHIPLPPIAEQKRIVAKVEQLLARVNVARERLAKVPEILKRFRQSVLAAACSGRLTADWRNENSNLEAAARLIKRIFTKREEQFKEGVKKIPKKPARLRPRKVEVKDLPEIPEQWAWVYLPDLGYMSRGKSRHRPRNAPHLYGGPYPFIQTGDIARCGGRITSHQQTYSEEGLAQSRLWTVGTVCITIAANIASSAILTYPACFPDSVVGVNPDVNLCLPEYLEFFIRTAQADLDQFAPATAQKNINVAILNDVVVPLPPFAEQQEIVRRVNSLFKLADAIDNRVEVASVRAEKLIQSILAKAFRGELVPNEAELARREGRDYEPASVLLECIKAERETIRKERRPKKQIVSRRRSHRKLAKATAT
ncbi:MAG: restriction endonuclease subunit S [Dissulfuribacterales bacterium]